MFENPSSVSHAGAVRFGDSPSHDSEALRVFDWKDLTARLNAVRDLRHALRRDRFRTIGDSAHDFADAAARYFGRTDEGLTAVNPVVSEHHKGSPGIVPSDFSDDVIPAESEIEVGAFMTRDARED